MYLRDIAESDRDQLLSWRNLPAVAKYMYTDHQISPDEHQAWFDGLSGDATRHYRIIEWKEEDVGLVYLSGIDRKNGRCSWGFYLASPSVRGRGVGSCVEFTILDEVFHQRGLRKLCCEVLAFNDAVVAMHEKFGFRREGLLRKHIRKGESWHDVVVMGVFSEEWEAVRPSIEAKLRKRGLLA